jgi:Icc-related predicted phosphoesterase
MTLRYLILLASVSAGLAQDSPFLAKPYLQLGNRPELQRDERMLVMWHGQDADEPFAVEFHRGPGAKGKWTKALVQHRRIDVSGSKPFRVYEAELTKLKPGGQFRYRVGLAGKPVFEAAGLARRPASQDSRVVIFGDCAEDTEGQRKIAVQTAKLKPDYVFITGDIVYSRGKISEYRDKYFPVYNSDTEGPAGAPLIRSTLFLGAPGNHDIGTPVNLSEDTMAYFYFWRQPLNGPTATKTDPGAPQLKGNAEEEQRFLKSAGEQFPRMQNFSFDYGMAHWTVLDSNPYTDWTEPKLRAWVEQDLAKAQSARWRFVALHHPPYNSSRAHFSEQRIRVLSDLFEKYKVAIVFAGHVHNYQRTFPLKFKTAASTPRPLGKQQEIAGEWEFDKNYDGKTKTTPAGPIYLVTGAGGAGLYNPDQQDNPKSWQPFTTVFKSTIHSLTLMDVKADSLELKQIGADGTVLDEYRITR